MHTRTTGYPCFHCMSPVRDHWACSVPSIDSHSHHSQLWQHLSSHAAPSWHSGGPSTRIDHPHFTSSSPLCTKHRLTSDDDQCSHTIAAVSVRVELNNYPRVWISCSSRHAPGRNLSQCMVYVFVTRITPRWMYDVYLWLWKNLFRLIHWCPATTARSISSLDHVRLTTDGRLC